LLQPLAWLWRAGSAIHSERARRARRTLETPVVSIGALTMGGAGKSPMVAHLAARLREMGRNPAILTRGYKRISKEPMVIVPRGGKSAIESLIDETGDEAQMFIRAGDAHIGIGADRYEVGRRMEAELAPDIFLLDDGFQHAQLHRDHDVVLIDANDPEAGGVFPVGRLREPLSALGRATEIVITRVEPGDDAAAVEQFLRRYNPLAPIFRSSVVPLKWVDVDSEEELELGALKRDRIGAFCGLGAPESFWRTLERLGIKPEMRRVFPDHHRYTPRDFERLTKEADGFGADVLVTTEKDAMNLGGLSLRPLVKLYWLKIGIEIDREGDLLRRLLQKESVMPA
jgi:tetraacyldisaccharide 4'-kinase